MSNLRDPAAWDAYKAEAQRATYGINRMPSVYGDYSSLASMSGPAIGQKFYPGAQVPLPFGTGGGGLPGISPGSTPPTVPDRSIDVGSPPTPPPPPPQSLTQQMLGLPQTPSTITSQTPGYSYLPAGLTLADWLSMQGGGGGG